MCLRTERHPLSHVGLCLLNSTFGEQLKKLESQLKKQGQFALHKRVFAHNLCKFSLIAGVLSLLKQAILENDWEFVDFTELKPHLTWFLRRGPLPRRSRTVPVMGFPRTPHDRPSRQCCLLESALQKCLIPLDLSQR
jgi:hypothetical protein